MNAYLSRKKNLRKGVLTQRDALDLKVKIEYDKKIRASFLDSSLYRSSKKIFIYVSFRSEVDTHLLIQTMLRSEKKIYVPFTSSESREMKAVALDDFDDDLEAGHFGVMTVKKDRRHFAHPQEMDLIVMPGTVFDLRGHRIGYGAGYYDRFLQASDAETVGLCYNLQLVPAVPDEPHDKTVDHLLTEAGFLF
jgi:5-formyltetrahydrofolate cyclo-ligase